ncbi:hypothetical protein LEMA_P086100.1 [Plenodomus lingam JN3]|uniref:Uncharacterized protein n=1 Tax=Leptosphaeria maculans (strain JN3 / isolate v23.1.3 / race Av1-4-5-6-7-8) TaxID=985895 RepID=E5A6X6_LEPMJ|nr:hypothetical protein LEMA_P086100.1 [Plenodomus lingam JN3]CBX99371.1 hypothetical protein LEMA_P086100.1 [Plenodomus lingam JN3]
MSKSSAASTARSMLITVVLHYKITHQMSAMSLIASSRSVLQDQSTAVQVDNANGVSVKISSLVPSGRRLLLTPCPLRKLRDLCKEECNGKWRVSDARKKMCRDECDEKVSCHQYCMEKTCCMGHEHCRQAGSHYRCGDIALQCDSWKEVSPGPLFR